MEIVAVIPARAGSKGIKDKNIRELNGMPLMCYSIKAAVKAKRISHVYINSESEKYLEIGEKAGAKKFLRPEILARDDTPMNQVISHFAAEISFEIDFHAIMVLYPTYPDRTSEDIDKILEWFEEIGGRTPLIGIKPPSTHPFMIYQSSGNGLRPIINPNPNKYYRRQDYPPFYEISHYCCVLPVKEITSVNAQLMNEKTIGYTLMSKVDVDTPRDFEKADKLVKNGK